MFRSADNFQCDQQALLPLPTLFVFPPCLFLPLLRFSSQIQDVFSILVTQDSRETIPFSADHPLCHIVLQFTLAQQPGSDLIVPWAQRVLSHAFRRVLNAFLDLP